MSDNRHPADELQEVRNKLHELEKREQALRVEVLGLPRHEREGRSYYARVVEKKRKVLDVEALEDRFGDLSEFYLSRSFNVIYLEKLKDEE